MIYCDGILWYTVIYCDDILWYTVVYCDDILWYTVIYCGICGILWCDGGSPCCVSLAPFSHNVRKQSKSGGRKGLSLVPRFHISLSVEHMGY